jgi:hypothetical protein
VCCLLCCVVLQDGLLHKTADWALAVAIPVHMHITTNALVTDYVATRFRGMHCPVITASTSHTAHCSTAHCRHGLNMAQHTAAQPARTAAVPALPLGTRM